MVLLLPVLLNAPPLASQAQIDTMEFHQAPVTDILIALGKSAGVSIVPDATVNGIASHVFASTSLEDALTSFLSACHLYWHKENDVYFVSRVRCIRTGRDGARVTVDADEVPVKHVLEALASRGGVQVTYKTLPEEKVTLHVAEIAPSELLPLLFRGQPRYTVTPQEGVFHIQRVHDRALTPVRGVFFQNTGDYCQVSASGVGWNEVITRVGQEMDLRTVNMLGEKVIEAPFTLRAPNLSTLLRMVLDSRGADISESGGIYYIFEVTPSTIISGVTPPVIVTLRHISTAGLMSLLPPEFIRACRLRADPERHLVFLSGSNRQTEAARRAIEALDTAWSESEYHRFDLSYLDVSTACELLPDRLLERPPVPIPGTTSLVFAAPDHTWSEIAELLRRIDIPVPAYPVSLHHITSDRLLDNLPPAASEDNIVLTPDPRCVFFVGPAALRRLFLQQLARIDRPRPQIRYELLIVQAQSSRSLDIRASLENRRPRLGDRTTILGHLGELLTVNFDVVTTLGYRFAAELSAELANNSAELLADTTLRGVSGETVQLENTSTYRYRDLRVDPDTGAFEPTGVTREIESGITLEVTGQVIGDRCIEMTVIAGVSRQGVDISSKSGNPPPTSSKRISAIVRTDAGQPVAIGGLIQRDVSVTEKKTPFLGEIPLLGFLFRHRTHSGETSETTIYLVPFLDTQFDQHQSGPAERIQELYRLLQGGAL